MLSTLWAVEQGNLTAFSHSKTFSMLPWGQAECRPTLGQTLGSEQTTLSRTQNENSSPATGRPSQAEKGSQKYSKIPRALQPCVATPRKEIPERRFTTGQHRQGTSPEFLNEPETQSFLLECCFLLSTIPKQRVFSAMQVKTIAAGFSDGQPLWKCLQRCKYPLGPIFWRLLPSDYQCFSASIATCSFLSAKYCLNSPAQHFAPVSAGKKDIWKCHWSDEGLILRKVIEKYNSKEQQALTWACKMWKFILSWFL